MKKVITVFFLVLVFSSSTFAGPGLIITEVFYDEFDSVLEEWFEIFNPTLNLINLKNYYFIEGSVSNPSLQADAFESDTFISPGQAFVIARNSGTFQVKYGFSPDSDILSLGLNNTGDFIKFYDPDSNLVDFVAWEGGISGWNIHAEDSETIARVAFPSLPSSWVSNQTPTPGTTDLNPIPEPNTLILLGCGLLVLGIVRKRNIIPKLKPHLIKEQSGNNRMSQRR